MVCVDGYAAEATEGCVFWTATAGEFMKFPFMLTDDAWKNLSPKPIETLGQDPMINPELKLVYHTIRELDQRSEWSCTQIVKMNNRQIYIIAVLAALVFASRPELLLLLTKFIP